MISGPAAASFGGAGPGQFYGEGALRHGMNMRKFAAMILSLTMLLTTATGCDGGAVSSGGDTVSGKGSAVSGTSLAEAPDKTQQGETRPGGTAGGNTDGAQGDGTQAPGSVDTNGGPGQAGTRPQQGNPANSGHSATAATTQGGGSSVKPDTTDMFSIDVSGLSPKTVYIVERAAITNPPKGLLEHDAARLICSLQGLINRDFKKNQIALYIQYDDTDTFWYNQMAASGGILSGYRRVTISTLTKFLDTFQNQLKDCGMVLWDPDVPATANVAATICGLDGYLPVKYEEDGGLMAMLEDLGVKSRLTLVGRFTGRGIITGTKIASTGSKKCDAYLWAMEKYMDRTSREIIAYMPDGAGCVATNPIYSDSDAKTAFGNNLYDHDYLIANACFFFDLSPVGTEAPCDDTSQQAGTDLNTMRRILQRQYDRNSGKFSQIIGFPPWWIKYTSHNNWGSLPATTVEWMFTDIATQYNLAKEADAAHPCCMTNASLYQHVPLTGSYKNTNRKTTVTEKFDSKTVYLLYYMGDYDSSAWLKKWVPTLWADSGKGDMPMMWSFNPNLSDRMPVAFNYVYGNMDSMDYFAAGDSGAGYIIPGGLYQAVSPDRPNPDGDAAWAAYCKPYFQKFDMDIVGFIINGNYKMNASIMKLYNQFAPVGSFHNDPSKPLYVADGTPYVYLKNGVGDPGNYQESAEGMYSYLKNNMAGLNFGAFRTICWTPSQIKQLSQTFLNYAMQRDPNTTYKFVDPYTYFAMIRQSGQGTKA